MPKKISLLKSYRVLNELTQKEMADKLDISITSLRAWEQKDITPPVHYILKIQDLLGVTLDQLMNDYNNKEVSK